MLSSLAEQRVKTLICWCPQLELDRCGPLCTNEENTIVIKDYLILLSIPKHLTGAVCSEATRYRNQIK